LAITCALAGFLLLCGLVAVFFLEGAPFERQAKLQKSASPS